MVELILDKLNIFSGGGSFQAITAFRAFRLFRILKLARFWVGLRKLLIAIAKTLTQLNNFLVLLILFVILSSLIGMEFFAYKVRFDENDQPTMNK